jgi:hypothetical protein
MMQFDKQNGNEGSRFTINWSAATMMAISAVLFGSTNQLYANPLKHTEKISNPKFVPAIVWGSNVTSDIMRPFASASMLENASLAKTAAHIVSCEELPDVKNPKTRIDINSKKPITKISLHKDFSSKPVIFKHVLCPIIEGRLTDDFSVLFNEPKVLEKYLQDRLKDSPSKQEFDKLIESGSVLWELQTYKDPSSGTVEFTQKVNKQYAYPTTMLIRYSENSDTGNFTLVNNGKNFTSGVSGTGAQFVNNASNQNTAKNNFDRFTATQHTSLVFAGLTKKSKIFYRLNKESNVYEPVKGSNIVGDISMLGLIKIQFLKIKHHYPELNKLSFEQFINNGGDAIIISRDTREKYSILYSEYEKIWGDASKNTDKESIKID